MDKVVVGVDGSAGSAVALQWAARLAVKTGAEVVASHAFRPPWSEVSHDDHERLIAERKTQLEKHWVRPAIEAGATVRFVIRDDDPRDLLTRSALSEQPALVVVGRTGKAGGPGFLHLGSVAEHLAHNIDRPLAVIPSGATGPIQRIVVGVDGSEPSLNAVRWCVPVAQAFDAEVIAVTVDEPFLEWTTDSSPDNWRRDIERHLQDWVAPLTSVGVPVELVTQRNLHPADGLLGTASAQGGDLIVVGARGLGGITGLRSGGVAMKVLHRAAVPLVIVPSAD